MEKTTIEVPEEEWQRLLQAADWLNCLQAAGVNTWTGYADALQIYDQIVADATTN